MKQTFSLLLLISAFASFLLCPGGRIAAAGPEQSWPIFHGPLGDNKSPDTGLLKEWPEGGPKLLWTADFLGHGYSGVVIADGRIYTSGNVEEDGKTQAMIFCLDMDGNLIWKTANGPGLTDSRRYPGTRSTPTIEGGFLYDESAIGDVSCFDLKTGEQIWTRNIMKDFETEMHRWALAESLLVEGNNVICAPGGKKASVVALDKKTGETVWTAEPSGALNGFATPYIFEFDGLLTLAVFSEDTIICLNPENGKVRFTFPLVNMRKINATIPIYHDGHLFLTSGYGGGARLLKLERDGEKIKPTEVWYEKWFDNHHGGLVLVGDHVFGTTHNGTWGAINFMTGEAGFRDRAIGSGAIHYADGLLYGLSEAGKTVTLFKPNPEKYEEISRFVLPNDVEGMSWAHPVVLGGRLYLRHGKYLYCYDVKAK